MINNYLSLTMSFLHVSASAQPPPRKLYTMEYKCRKFCWRGACV